MALTDPIVGVADEIRSYVQGDDLEHATKRLLDFAKDFSGDREVVNSTIVLRREYTSIRSKIRRNVVSDETSSLSLNRIADRILKMVSEIEESAESPSRPGTPPPQNLRLVSDQEAPVETPRAEDQAGERQNPPPHPPTRFEKARDDFLRRRRPVRSESTSVLDVRSVGKSFGDSFHLSPVTLSLEPGEILGLVGVNGSGKTTLLRILAGELAADGGELSYPLLSESLDWIRIRPQIAFVPQRPRRWYGILEENLYLHAALRGLTGRENEDEVEFVLNRLGLESYRRSGWNEISGGFQMRYELAKALTGRPGLLILDEPLAPLDINTQQVFLQDLRDIADSYSNPLPIILSSQHIFEVEAISDRILFLDDGEVKFYGALTELYDDRRESTYEIASGVEKTDIWDCLDSLGVIDVQYTGLTYLVSLPPTATARQVLEALLGGGIEMSYFRDISGSSRKLFKDRGEA